MAKTTTNRYRYHIPDPTEVITDEIILQHIEAGSKVVDLGCGDGRLLSLLRDEHDCEVLGVELDQESIFAAVSRGVSVVRDDLDQGIPTIPSGAFDYAVLSQTLQQVRNTTRVLREMLRIARRALVVLPNYGNWKVRVQVALHGRAPVTEALPYEWFDTPNVHWMSLRDFRDLVDRMGIRIVKELPIIGKKAVGRAWAANFRADNALYVLESANSETTDSKNVGQPTHD